jgi:DNA-binding FadR family transcriptional regulator
LYPARWIIERNPEYRYRAYFKGDLRASILEELKDHPDAGEKESELARRCGAERTTIREALDDPELAGLIERWRRGIGQVFGCWWSGLRNRARERSVRPRCPRHTIKVRQIDP